MSNPNLQKVIKLTQSQYDILANGGTVGDFTGLNDNYLYLIQEDYEFPTTTTARKILMSTSTAGLVSWQSLTANDIPSLDASKINSGIFNASRIPNLNASKINAGTFDIARIPTGTTASTVALGNHNHDSVYLGINAKAADSNKLNGQLASYYAIATHDHDSRYLKLSGGTMTGNISYQGSLSTNAMIKFLNNTSDAYGNGIAIGGGGIVIIGAGESSDLSYGSAGDENLYLAADTAIHFYSNAQSGLSSAKHMIFDNSGVLQGMNSIVVTHPSGGGSEYKINSTNYSLSFMIGSGDINRGIYDHTNNSWMIYRDDTTNVYINGAIYENGTALSNKYLAKNAQAKDSAKLNGQEASYYLNYNNLTNKPSAVLYTSQTLTDAQKQQARTNIGAGTSSLTIGTTATTAAAGNHTHDYSSVYLGISAKAADSNKLNGQLASYYATATHDHDGVYVKYSAAQTLTNDQKAQARSNIGAGTSSFTGYTSGNKLSTNYIQNDAGWSSFSGYTSSNKLSTNYIQNDAGWTSNAGTVIGSGLTAEYFVVGNGTVNVKISSMRPSTSSTTWSTTSDVYVPTMKAISNYISSLGYTTVTESTVSGWGFTKNIGTVTSITLGLVAYNPDSGGVVALPAYPTTLPASDVYAWAKASTKPSYTYSEVGAAASNHNHDSVYLKLSGGTLTGHLKWHDSSALPSATNLGVAAEYILCIKAFADGGDTFYETKSNFLSGYATTTWVGNNYLGKTATAADSTKLNGQAASYYLNYNNLSNTPSSLPASDVYAWAKAATKPSYTASEVGALASNAKVVLYSLQSLTNIQKATARLNIGAGTSDLEIGNTATTAAAGNHTHTLSITSGGSSPTTLAANTTYTLTAGGSTLVFKTPAAGGGSAYYANQYNQWYYFSNSSSPYISSKIGLTNLTTYENSNLFFGFNSIPEDMQTSLGYGHNIKTSSRAFIMDLAIGSGYMSQLVFSTIGYDITKIYARTDDAWGGYVGEPDEVSKLGELYLETSSLHGTKVVNSTRYEFNIGRRCHCIHFSNSTNHAFFNILTSDAPSYTSFSSAASILYNTGHRSITSFLKATGIYGSYTKPVVGVFATSSSSLSIVYMNGTTVSSTSFTSGNVADSEINTVYEP